MLNSPRSLLLALGLSLGALGWANPSTFPEHAAFASVGYRLGPAGSLGAELLVPTPYLDTSVGAQLYGGLGGVYGLRFYGTGLVFPALGSSPPLALGLGADLGLESARGFNLHAGLVAGSDLLFTLRQPMTVSAYLAPGYAARGGFSLAWALQVRYYLDEVALELSSSDLLLIGVSARYLF